MICLLNCHLAAHMEHMTERVDDFVYILDTQKFDCEKAQRIVDHKWEDINIKSEHFLLKIMRKKSSKSELFVSTGWCYGWEILTSEFKTMNWTTSTPASTTKPTTYCGAKTRFESQRNPVYKWFSLDEKKVWLVYVVQNLFFFNEPCLGAAGYNT